MKNNKLSFNPFDAISITQDVDGEYMHVDDDLLAANIDWKPSDTQITADWKPNKIDDYDNLRVLHVDIETTGLDPTMNRVIMLGVIANENDSFAHMLYGEQLEQLKNGKIFQVVKKDNNVAEALAIANFIIYLRKLKPQVLDLHNGFEFDTKFIQKRIEILRDSISVKKAVSRYPKLRIIEDDLFYIGNYEKTITSASMFGRPIQFTPVYTIPPRNGYFNIRDKDIQIIDTMHLAAQVDKIRANMSSYGLKYLAHWTGFRPERRLELSHTEIKEYWQSQDPEKLGLLRQYLIYDLEDQRAVGNYFIPPVWYQKMFVNMPLQELAVASPAKKWNTILDDYYSSLNEKSKFSKNADWHEIPEPDDKISYQGALVNCSPGLYRNFFKIDISSLYPSLIELFHLIDTNKDPHKVSLIVLGFAKRFRYVFKAAAGDNPHQILDMPEYQYVSSLFNKVDLNNITARDRVKFGSMDGTQKVVINGFYGFLGVGGYNFNSMGSAALTTAYGRVLMRMMIKESEKWATIINLDTDGLCLQPKLSSDVDWSFVDGYEICPNTGEHIPAISTNDDNEEYVHPRFIWSRVQKILPEGIRIDTEDVCPDGAIYAPKMKNYVFWENSESKPKTKGVFRKRNRSLLQRTFPINYLYNLAFQDDDCADEYYQGIADKLKNFDTSNISSDDLELVTYTQNIAVNNITLTGFNVGKPKDKVSYVWCAVQEYTPAKKQPKKNKTKLPVKVTITQQGEYLFTPQSFPDKINLDDVDLNLNTQFYLDDLNKIKTEIDKTVGLV